MSFRRIAWMGALLGGGAIGAAVACGPFFPWQLLDNRAETVAQPIDLGFGFEVARLVPAASDGLRAVERADWSNPPPAPEAPAAEQQEAKSGAWQDYLPPASKSFDADKLLARLRLAREAKDGKAALDRGDALPEAVALYIAGAVEFNNAARLDEALAYFEQIVRLPPERRRIRAVAASYMQGQVHQIKGEMEAARRAFQATRAAARSGAPDPMGLAVASLGEEARIDLIEGGVLESPWTKETAPNDNPESAELIARGIQLYVEQAARGSQIGLQSLRDVSALILDDEELLGRIVSSPVVRRVLVAYVVARDEDGWQETPSAPTVAAQLLTAVLAQGEPAAGDDIDRLAAVAYRAGRYEDAERLVKTTMRPLGLWVRAKLALRRGDRDAAVRDWTAALTAGQESGAERDLDRSTALRLRGEAAVAELSAGHYQQSFNVLMPAATTYWGDVAYLAERILSVDELKVLVDGLKDTPVPPKAKPDDADDFTFIFDPVRSLQSLLARRLMREGRYREALPYFTAAAARKPRESTVDDGAAAAKSANDFVAAFEAAGQTWPWQNVTRAEALFKLAMLSRTQGMELMGTEGPPDVYAVGGNFAFGAGQTSPAGWVSSERSPESMARSSALFGPDEARRFEASAATPDVRFHYRAIAADRALAVADLLPQRSQAYAATLCWAASFATDSGDLKRAEGIYRRYVKTGAYQSWAKTFGQDCPDPDFKSARTFWLKRIAAWPVALAGSAWRHAGLTLAAALVLVFAAVGLIRARRTQRQSSST
jgi:tetratricopeptide (TPR) repeat protein